MARSRSPRPAAPCKGGLRADAEAQAALQPATTSPPQPPAEMANELNVHRIELEMQNEELRRTQVALETARDRYVDLYDFAPVGYVTVGVADGLITEANLTGAQLLGIERTRLVGQRFARHIALTDRDHWYRHTLLLGRQKGPGRIELTLLGRDGHTFHAQIDSLRVHPFGASPMLHIALTDITERKRAELYRRVAATATAGREADRRRVALQLHEDLGQRLCAVKMDLDSLHGEAEDQPARHKRMGAMLAELDNAVTLVRHISADLRPAMLDQLGLSATIEWLVHDTGQRLGLAVALKQDDIEPPLDDASAVAVYRLVQDVLNRLVNPPPSRDVAISVRRQAPGLVVSLQAQGLALADPADSAPRPSPLHERAEALGGHLALEANAPGGACITVRVPLEPTEGGQHLRLTAALS